jgi:DNA recombination protein RmuC
MQSVLPVLSLLCGIAVGAIGMWFVLQARLRHAVEQARNDVRAEMAALPIELANRDQRIQDLQSDREELQHTVAQTQQQLHEAARKEGELSIAVQEEQRRAAENIQVLDDAQKKLLNAFKALSSDALKNNNESFLKLASTTLEKFQESAKGDLEKRQEAIDSLVKPVEKSLLEVDKKLQEVEKNRLEAYTGLKKEVSLLHKTHNDLRSETANLVKALRRPDVRGRWGEIQLRRVVEMAGMLEHCDFTQQTTVNSENGLLRPDMIVQLPGGKNIVADSKAPLHAYLEAIEADDEQARLVQMKAHAKAVKDHIQTLSKKSYFAQFDHAPEFVVLFLPGEVFFSAALEHDPTLIEMGVEQNVIIATPTTLIALLKSVAYGWTQDRLADNAREISVLGKELYGRLAQMGTHLAKVGKSLEGATKAYNSAVGTLEGRVLVTARKFDDLDVSVTGKDLDALPPIEQTPRQFQAIELRPPTSEAVAH